MTLAPGRAMHVPKLFLGTLALLAGIRLSLAAGIEHYVNRTLNRHADYAGHIGTVRLDLWRGAYVIEDLALLKRSGQSTEPFLSATSVDLSVKWSALIHGAIVGEVTFNHPSLNFVLSPAPEEEQTKIDSDWRKTLLDLFPFQIDQIQVRDGTVRFKDLRKQPVVDVSLDDLQARLTNLTNIRKDEKKSAKTGTDEALVTTLDAIARAQGDAGFWMKLRLDPFATRPTFDVDAAIEGLDLVKLNDFLRAYAKLDVKRGTFHAYIEAAAAEGRITGYVKPFFEDLDFVDLSDLQKPSDVVHVAWEATAGAVAKLLENKKTEKVATRIPIEGRIDSTKTDVWVAVGTLLRNAFLRALRPGVEGSVTVGEAEKKQTEKEKQQADEDEHKKQQQDSEKQKGGGP
jgi:hypothetical protein